MDGWVPKGGSVPPGDGAFERFLTAAIAAIITIMFSWRLLDDMSDAEKAAAAVVAEEAGRRRRAAAYAALAAQPAESSDRQIAELDIDEDDDTGDVDGDKRSASDIGHGASLPQSDSGYESLVLSSNSVDGQECTSVDLMKRFTSAPPVYLQSAAPAISSDDFVRYRSTGYKSEASMDRKDKRDNSPSDRNVGDVWGDDRDLSDSDKEMMDDGTTCFEWPPESGDDFVNVSGDSDDVQPRELDSDEELYCCSLLEPIIEEDSDDILSSSDDHDSLKHLPVHPHLHSHFRPYPDEVSRHPEIAVPLAADSGEFVSRLPPSSPLVSQPSPQAVVEDIFKEESPLIPVGADSSSSHSQDADDSESDESVQTVVHRGSVSSSTAGSLESSPLHGPRFFQSTRDVPVREQHPATTYDRYGGSSFPGDADSARAYAEDMQDLVSRVFDASRPQPVAIEDSSEQEENSSETESEKTIDNIPDTDIAVRETEIDSEVSARHVAQLNVTPLSAVLPQAHESETRIMVTDIDPLRNNPSVSAHKDGTDDNECSDNSDTRIEPVTDKNANFDTDVDKNTHTDNDFKQKESAADGSAETGRNIDDHVIDESDIDMDLSSTTKTPSAIDSFLTEYDDEPFARRFSRRDLSPKRGFGGDTESKRHDQPQPQPDNYFDISANSDTETDRKMKQDPMLTDLQDEPVARRPGSSNKNVEETDLDVYDHSPNVSDPKTDTSVDMGVGKISDPFLTEFEEEPFTRRRGGSVRSYDKVETDLTDKPAREINTIDVDKDTQTHRENSVRRSPDSFIHELDDEPFTKRLRSGSDRSSVKSDEFDRSARSDTDSYKSGKNNSDHDGSVEKKSISSSIDSFLTELDEEPFARRLGRRRRSPDRSRDTEKVRAVAEAPALPIPDTVTVTKTDTREVIESPVVSPPVFSPPTKSDTSKSTAMVPDSPTVSLPPSLPSMRRDFNVTSTPEKPQVRMEVRTRVRIEESPTVSMPPLLEEGPEDKLSLVPSSVHTVTNSKPDPFSDANVSNAVEQMPRGYTFMRCESESSRSERRIFLVDEPLAPDFETLINSVPFTSETVAELEHMNCVDWDDYTAFVQDLHRPNSSEFESTPTIHPPPLNDGCILSGNLVSPPTTDVFKFPQPKPQLPAVSSVAHNLYGKEADSAELYSDTEGTGQMERDKSSKAEGSTGILDTSFDVDNTQAREKMETDFAFLQSGQTVCLPADDNEKSNVKKEEEDAGKESADSEAKRTDDEQTSSDDEPEWLDERPFKRPRRRRRDDSGGRRDDRKRRRGNRKDGLDNWTDKSGDNSAGRSDDSKEMLVPDSRKEETTEIVPRDKNEMVNRSDDREDQSDDVSADSVSNKQSVSLSAEDMLSAEQAQDVMSKTETTDSHAPVPFETTAKLEEAAPILFFQPAARIHEDITQTSVQPIKTQPQKPPRAEKKENRTKKDHATDNSQESVTDLDNIEVKTEVNEVRDVDKNEDDVETSPQIAVMVESSEHFPLSEEPPCPKPRQMARPTPMPRSKSLGDNVGTPAFRETGVEEDVFKEDASDTDSNTHSSLKDDEEEEELLFQPKQSAPLAFKEKRPRSLKEIRRKLSQQRTNPRPLIAPFTLPDHMVLPSRLKIMASRRQFLSSENIDSTGYGSLQDQFAAHKHSQQQTKERRYKSPNKKLRSPTFSSQDQLEKLHYMLNYSRHSESSFDRSLIDHLHEGCILTPQGRRNILDKTLSIENLQIDLPQHLRRYGSVTSLVETDIDTGETQATNFFPETNLDIFDCLFQPHQPLQRSASMSDLVISEQGDPGLDQRPRGLSMAPFKTHKSTGKDRFAYRKYQKSKSLCTLETNLDDVGEEVDTLKRVPSVHELRVTKSLQKLNVPDWFKQSSLTKSSSCLLKYGSNSTMNSFSFSPSLISSPCASTAPPAPNVVIKTRVVPPSNPRLIRSPGLFSTAPSSDKKVPQAPVKLPSSQMREKEKNKNLMPIPIVPFAQIRAMFEKKGKKGDLDEKDKKGATKETPKTEEIQEAKLSSKTSAVPSISISSTEDQSSNEQSQPVKRTLFTGKTSPAVVEESHTATVSLSSSSQPQTVPPTDHRATNGVRDDVDGNSVSSPFVKSVSQRTEAASPPSSSVGHSGPSKEKQQPSASSVEQKQGRDLKDKTHKDTPKDSQKDAQKSPPKDPKQQFSPSRSLRQFFGLSKDKSSDKKSDGGGSLDSSFSSGDGVYEKEPRRLGVAEISKRFDSQPKSTTSSSFERSRSREDKSDFDSSFSSGDGLPSKDRRTPSESSGSFPASASTRPPHYNSLDRQEPSLKPGFIHYDRPEPSDEKPGFTRFDQPKVSEQPAPLRFDRPEVSDPPKFQRRLPGAGTAYGRLPSTENGDYNPEPSLSPPPPPPPSTGAKGATEKKSLKETTV